MKKCLLFVVLFLFSFNAYCSSVRVDYSDVNLRTGPSTSTNIIKKLAVNSSYTLASESLVNDSGGCSDGWYHIYYSSDSTGYVCSSYVTKIVENVIKDTPTTDCETDLYNKGFPSSYWTYLCSLKEKYPNWNFIADKNGLDFTTVINKESVTGKSLIQTKNEGWLSTSSDAYNYLTDTFTVKEGSNWYAAAPEVVAYYLDPRNFLDEKYIFMFEKLSFDEGYQTIAAIESVLDGRDLKSLSSVIYDASKDNNINAIYLSSRIRQETGANYSNYSLAGNSITNNGAYYEHVYNPYNIGANTGAYDGLVWAVNGSTYLRPWTTIEVAIKGGANVIASTYISKGQDTGYFQKFNTSSYSQYSAYSHQYMTNIKAAFSEASISYNSYKDMNLLGTTNFTFVIPVYGNMQTNNYVLPAEGNPNNHLNSIKINNTNLKGFNHSTFNYTYYVAKGINEIDISVNPINGNAKVEGAGKIAIKNDQNDIQIKVTAQNGQKQIYKIKVIKTDGIDMNITDIVNNMDIVVNDNYFDLKAGYTIEQITNEVQKTAATAKVEVNGKSSGMLVTGDLVTIKNGSDTKAFNISIKGDPSGDGNINISDLLKVQKYILGYSDLSGSYYKAADTNNDGVIDIVDLLRVQKHILGYLTI